MDCVAVPLRPSWCCGPLQSLCRKRRSGTLGSPLPVQPWRSPTPGPSGIPAASRARGRDSSGDPLLGFSPPSRYCSFPLPPTSRRKAPLLGFRPLQRMKQAESTFRVCARIRRGSHPVGYGAARRLFQPLNGLFLRPPSDHFQAGYARGVSLQGIRPLAQTWRLVTASMPSRPLFPTVGQLPS